MSYGSVPRPRLAHVITQRHSTHILTRKYLGRFDVAFVVSDS